MNNKWFGTGRVATGALAGLALAVVVSGAAASGSGVTLATPFDGTQQLVINGTTVGNYPYYMGLAPITFSWTAYWPPYVAGSPNAMYRAYRVSVWQNTTPLASAPTWAELNISDHWIDDPNPTTFTLPAFLDVENVCHNCPSMIVVQPETFQYDPNSTSDSPFIYTPVTTANQTGVPALIKSGQFLITSNLRLRDVDECSNLPPGPLHRACEGN